MKTVEILVKRLDSNNMTTELGSQKRIDTDIGADVDHMRVVELAQLGQEAAHIRRLPKSIVLKLFADVLVEFRVVYAHHCVERLFHSRWKTLKRPLEQISQHLFFN